MVDLVEGKMSQEKALCFVLDPANDPPKKKRKKSAGKKAAATTPVTFGAKMDLGKLTQCKAFQIAWRVRCGSLKVYDSPIVYDFNRVERNTRLRWV